MWLDTDILRSYILTDLIQTVTNSNSIARQTDKKTYQLKEPTNSNSIARQTDKKTYQLKEPTHPQTHQLIT